MEEKKISVREAVTILAVAIPVVFIGGFVGIFIVTDAINFTVFFVSGFPGIYVSTANFILRMFFENFWTVVLINIVIWGLISLSLLFSSILNKKTESEGKVIDLKVNPEEEKEIKIILWSGNSDELD